MSKKCFVCERKLGFRDWKINHKQCKEECLKLQNPEIMPKMDEFSFYVIHSMKPHESVGRNSKEIMQDGDLICRFCWQSHCIFYHMLAVYEEVKSKKMTKAVPDAIFEKDPKSTETFEMLYLKEIDTLQKKIDETFSTRECTICKKKFKQHYPKIIDIVEKNLIFDPICSDFPPNKNQDIGISLDFECNYCREITYKNNNKIKELELKITHEKNKIRLLSKNIGQKRSQHNSAKTDESINTFLGLIGNTASQFQTATAKQSVETSRKALQEARLERDIVESKIELLEAELIAEKERMIKDHNTKENQILKNDSNEPSNDGSRTEDDEAVKILKIRYAKGEITKEEFEQMKKDVS